MDGTWCLRIAESGLLHPLARVPLTPSSEVESALAGGCGRVCCGSLDTLMHAPRHD
jgi:hypothetical protein